LLNGPTIYRELGNANIAQTYIDTDSHKLKQIKAVIIYVRPQIRVQQWNKTTYVVQSILVVRLIVILSESEWRCNF